MDDQHPVVVLRLGHRPGRDDRMTTHVALTARALGADRVLLEPEATQAADTARDITGRFGGPFDVEQTDDALGRLRDWDGTVVHLTMYGEPIQTVESQVANAHDTEPVLVVVGAKKVPFEVYERAEYNVAVTNQPHSEIAALAVFLDRLFDGDELERTWEDARKRVVPMTTGKKVVGADDPANGVDEHTEPADDDTTDPNENTEAH